VKEEESERRKYYLKKKKWRRSRLTCLSREISSKGDWTVNGGEKRGAAQPQQEITEDKR